MATQRFGDVFSFSFSSTFPRICAIDGTWFVSSTIDERIQQRDDDSGDMYGILCTNVKKSNAATRTTQSIHKLCAILCFSTLLFLPLFCHSSIGFGMHSRWCDNFDICILELLCSNFHIASNISHTWILHTVAVAAVITWRKVLNENNNHRRWRRRQWCRATAAVALQSFVVVDSNFGNFQVQQRNDCKIMLNM